MSQQLSKVSRPVQLDSYDLDKSFIDILTSRIEALQVDSLSEYSSEIRLLLKVYLWFHKIFKSESTIGMESYSLQYADPQRRPMNTFQRISFLIEPLTSYFVDRYSDRLSYSTQKTVNKLLAVIQTLEVINYFAFLYNGRYRTLLERLFSIQVFGPKKQYSSNWNKTQMILNRELNWRLLSQILTLSLPLLLNNRFFNRHILRPIMGRTLNSTNVTDCAICSQPSTNTVRIDNCKHIFCYICIAGEILHYGEFNCSKCSITVKSIDALRLEK